MAARIYLNEDAIVSVNPTGLNFQSDGTDPAFQTLTFLNEMEDTADVSFTIAADEAWVVLGAASGSFSAVTPYELQVDIDVTGLDDGEYSATITLTTAFGDTEIPVVLVIDAE